MKKYYEDREYLNKVYDILENTEEDLLSKIPNSFMNFIKNKGN